jgi:hypothetical protein
MLSESMLRIMLPNRGDYFNLHTPINAEILCIATVFPDSNNPTRGIFYIKHRYYFTPEYKSIDAISFLSFKELEGVNCFLREEFLSDKMLNKIEALRTNFIKRSCLTFLESQDINSIIPISIYWDFNWQHPNSICLSPRNYVPSWS